MVKVKAFIIHKDNPRSKSTGSLLLLFEQFGTKIWLLSSEILNYKDLKHFDNNHEQEIEVNEEVHNSIKYFITAKKFELLKYKKKRKE